MSVASPVAAPPQAVTSVFGSTKRTSGRLPLPPFLQLKAAFGELKLDLRDAVLPESDVLLVCESLCASVDVLLPEGVTVADHSSPLLSSHAVGQTATGGGPVVHLEGWSVCSDVKVRTASALGAPLAQV